MIPTQKTIAARLAVTMETARAIRRAMENFERSGESFATETLETISGILGECGAESIPPGDGFAAFESSPRAAAGGFTLPDDCRAYFVPLDGGRLAQVCAARDAAGRWTLARPAVYRLADYAAAIAGGPDAQAVAAGDVAAAIESDPRRIVRA